MAGDAMVLVAEGGLLSVVLSGWDRLWAVTLRDRLVVPMSHVRGARALAVPPSLQLGDWRLPGTSLPGVITAGTYYTRRGREFWLVRGRGAPVLLVELEGERYERLVLGVPDASGWADRINAAIAAG